MSTAAPDLGDLFRRAASIRAYPPLAKASAQSAPIPASPWAYALFILVNASLFVRPAELLPEAEGWPIYAVLATLALLAALPGVLSQLTPASLRERPITVCVIGMLVAVVLSHLSASFVWGARIAGNEFFKVLAYFLLLLAVIDTPARLRNFLGWLVALGLVATCLALLQYHGWIDVAALAEIEHGYTDTETGDRTVVIRLVSTGIFNDPNDLCLLLVITLAACVHGLEDRRRDTWRYLWIAPLLLFGYALTLTHSRGGFLGVVAALVTFIWVRLGWRRGLPVASIALPFMFFVYAGRQTELAVGEGTAQERIQLWSEGLTLFRRAPFFGIGYGRFVEEIEKVAHNSFVHTFAELGFFGGTIFLGAFALALRSVQRIGAPHTVPPINPDLARLRPYVLAILVGYVVGMLSLSRAYVVPTYLVLGLAAAYAEIGRRQQATVALPRVNLGLTLRLGALAAAFLACTYVFVRTFVRWS